MADEQQAVLDDRYGASTRLRFDRRLAWITGSIVVLIGIGTMTWVTMTRTTGLEITPISSGPMSDFEYEAKFAVTAPPHSDVACAVEAISPTKANVGWKVIELPFGAERTQTVTARLLTTNPAVTAHATDCWIVEKQ